MGFGTLLICSTLACGVRNFARLPPNQWFGGRVGAIGAIVGAIGAIGAIGGVACPCPPSPTPCAHDRRRAIYAHLLSVFGSRNFARRVDERRGTVADVHRTSQDTLFGAYRERSGRCQKSPCALRTPQPPSLLYCRCRYYDRGDRCRRKGLLP